MADQKINELKLLREKPYTIRSADRGTVVNVPSTYLAMSGLKVGDLVFLYIDGNGDLLVSKEKYV